MQARIVVCPCCYQLEQSGKATLLVHHLKCNLILPAVEEQEGYYEVERVWGILLFAFDQVGIRIWLGGRTCRRL